MNKTATSAAQLAKAFSFTYNC